MAKSSQPPSIVTPSSLHLIRREGDMLEAAVKTLLDQRKIGVSLEGLGIRRKVCSLFTQQTTCVAPFSTHTVLLLLAAGGC